MGNPLDPRPFDLVGANAAIMTWLRQYCRPLYHVVRAGLWLHEIWHFLAARALGRPAQMDLDLGQTRYTYEQWWQALVIDLAPLAAGLIAGLACLALAFQAPTPVNRAGWAAVSAVMFLGWTAVCGYDVRTALRLLREWRRRRR